MRKKEHIIFYAIYFIVMFGCGHQIRALWIDKPSTVFHQTETKNQDVKNNIPEQEIITVENMASSFIIPDNNPNTDEKNKKATGIIPNTHYDTTMDIQEKNAILVP